MGIDCRLGGVEAVDRAREHPKSVMSDRVRDTVANQLRRLDRFRELWGADWT
jgi:hypothetical protein